MLTRVLFALIVLAGLPSGAFAGSPTIVALGLTARAATAEEVQRPEALAVPGRQTGGVAYALVDGLQPGDQVTVRLMNEGASLMHNEATAEEGRGRVFVQAGKTGVPAGGWPEGEYVAKVQIKRGGEMLIEETSEPIEFER